MNNQEYNVIENGKIVNSSSYEKKRREDKKKKIIIFSSVLVPAITLSIVFAGGFSKQELCYECDGVDEVWLQEHPFITLDLPTKCTNFGPVNLVAPKIDGYSFVCWHEKESGEEFAEGKYKGSFFAHKNITLVAKYEPIQYQIKLDLNGGQLIDLTNNKYQDHTYIVDENDKDIVHTTFVCTDKPFSLPKCEKEGYDLVKNEWKHRNSKTYLNAVNPAIDLNNFEAEAEWNLHPYSISYSFVGEGVDEFKSEIISNNVHSFDYETSINFATPFLEGYTFEGWFNKNDKQITGISEKTVPENDVFEVVGKFKPIEYKIFYDDRSNTNLSSFPKTFKRCSEDIIIPDINPNGYIFNGWVSSNVTTLQYCNIIEHGTIGNITFTAALDLIPYKVTFITNGVDTDFVDSFNLKSRKIDFNVESDSFTLPDASCTGYKFINFTDDKGNIVTEIKKGSFGDKVITANFEPIEYKITRSYRLHDEDQTQTFEQKYTIETPKFSLPSPSSDIKRFVGWTETTTKVLYDPLTKFGRGTVGNFNFEAKWSLNGEGTESSPYELYTANQLEQIEDLTAHYILMNDINVASSKNDVWVPVGSKTTPFSGEFNGNGKQINFFVSSNANENDDFTDYFGLFGYVDSNAYIHDFTIEGSVGSSESRFKTNLFGAVAAFAKGTVSNVVQNAEIHLTSSSSGTLKAGGLVGECNTPTIFNCAIGNGLKGCLDVYAPNTNLVYCGGITGYAAQGIIRDCSVNVGITSVALNNSFAGGLLGGRDNNHAIHLELSNLPSVNTPFSGQVSSSVVSETGNAGMAQYVNGKKAIIGEQCYTGLLGSTIVFKEGSYYYIYTESIENGDPIMCWMKYLGEGLFDSENPVNEIIYK